MSDSANIAGLVLAGGQSSRFGSPKALADLGGETLVERMLRLLGKSCGAVAVSASDAKLAAGATLLVDPAGAPAGPLAGVLAGLRWASSQNAEWLVTAPCDTPLLPEDFGARLVGAAQAANANVAAFASATGLHPLTAAWRTSILPAMGAQLATIHPPVHSVLEQLKFTSVPLSEEHLLNVNTPADLEIARKFLNRAGP